MKKLLILSGKGGTGKTTIASSFIKLSNAKAYADCDVDAPNLHLVLTQNVEPLISDYYGMPKANIDLDICIECDLCRKDCRFDSVYIDTGYKIDKYSCEGCGVCEAICPTKAIIMQPTIDGGLKLYKDEYTVFSTAELKMGSGTSGMLVTEVKKHMVNSAIDTELSIIDGSPGIGCPVIASISGVDMVLIVAEPSISGISDMERIIKTAEKFYVRIAVCINKFDININNSQRIEEFCRVRNIPYVGKIPFDSNVSIAINKGLSIMDIDCAAGRATEVVFNKTIKILYDKET